MSVSRYRIALGAVLAPIGCSGTGPSCCDPSPAQPAGWIYFAEGFERYPIQRLRIETGVVEEVVIPAPVSPESPPFLHLWEGMASPTDGSIAMYGPTGRFWPRTFVYDVSANVVTIRGDGENASVDEFHRWSPDGRWVVFLRHLATGSPVHLTRLEPATGLQDTLISAVGFQIASFFWVGSDSIGIYYLSFPEESGWKVMGTGETTLKWFEDTPDPGFAAPEISGDRRWMAYWTVEDSSVTGEGVVPFARLYLRDRWDDSESDLLLRQGRSPHTGWHERKFSLDSRFLAWCGGESELRIRDLIRETEVKRLHIAQCRSLSWVADSGEG